MSHVVQYYEPSTRFRSAIYFTDGLSNFMNRKEVRTVRFKMNKNVLAS